MHHELTLKEMQKEWKGSYKAYAIGFTFSFLLTTLSFLLVAFKILAGRELVYAIIGLGLVQAIFQLLFFLHLGQEEKPRWETVVFIFMLLLLLIIVIGSLWIMFDLNDRVMMGMTHD